MDSILCFFCPQASFCSIKYIKSEVKIASGLRFFSHFKQFWKERMCRKNVSQFMQCAQKNKKPFVYKKRVKTAIKCNYNLLLYQKEQKTASKSRKYRKYNLLFWIFWIEKIWTSKQMFTLCKKLNFEQKSEEQKNAPTAGIVLLTICPNYVIIFNIISKLYYLYVCNKNFLEEIKSWKKHCFRKSCA